MKRAANQSMGQSMAEPVVPARSVTMAPPSSPIAKVSASPPSSAPEASSHPQDEKPEGKGDSSFASSPTRMSGISSGASPVLMDANIVEKPFHDTQTKPLSSPAPLQQLQIVRLLQDLGDRLRQSEKEREILWRELEMCRKLVTDAEDKSSKAEKAYLNVEGQINKRDGFVEELVERQARLEKLVQDQAAQIETAQAAQSKVRDKISSLETTAGSAIVRIEEALSENVKLGRRLEQIGQDKARLIRKIETMEETLTLTQDTLKAKALVLLTDQALAAKTGLPQTPAWAAEGLTRAPAEQSPPPGFQTSKSETLESITASLHQTSLRNQVALSLALVVLAVGCGVAYNKWHGSSLLAAPPVEPAKTSSISSDSPKASPDQEAVMKQVAALANQIEPGGDDPVNDSSLSKVKAAEQRAVKDFEDSVAGGELKTRIQPDSRLPAAIKDIEARAFDGNGEAQHDLAAIYTAGRAGVKTNYTRAAKWFEEAAHNGIANAQYNLGVLYHQGLGVKADLKKALDLYRVAAANGHPEAQYNLGIASIEGVGAEYDPVIAAQYFEKAAEGGIPEAAYNLGLIHENGLLGESQPDEAVFWYSLAAGKGNQPAKTALADLKKQISMTDDDAARLLARMVVLKPAFATEEGGAALPEPDDKMQNALGVREKAPEKPVQQETVGSSVKSALSHKTKEQQDTAPKTDPVIVTQVQEQLIRLGLYNGAPDGVANAATEEAVRAYQTAHHLTVDGRASEDILVHILATEVGTTDPAAGKKEKATDPIPSPAPAPLSRD